MPPTSTRWWLAAPLPPLGAALAVAVIAHSVELARASGHLPRSVRFPPISLAGIYLPEYAHFAAGFAALALILAACEELRARALAPHLLRAAGLTAEARGQLAGARYAARAACLGLLLTGVVPLQLPPGHPRGGLATATHALAALAFFTGSQVHALQTLRALASRGARTLPASLADAPALFALKAVAALSSVLSFLPAQYLHPGGSPTSPHPGGAEAAELDAAGFTQWWTVASLLSYYALMGADFVLLSRLPEGGGEGGEGADTDGLGAVKKAS